MDVHISAYPAKKHCIMKSPKDEGYERFVQAISEFNACGYCRHGGDRADVRDARLEVTDWMGSALASVSRWVCHVEPHNTADLLYHTAVYTPGWIIECCTYNSLTNSTIGHHDQINSTVCQDLDREIN